MLGGQNLRVVARTQHDRAAIGNGDRTGIGSIAIWRAIKKQCAVMREVNILIFIETAGVLLQPLAVFLFELHCGGGGQSIFSAEISTCCGSRALCKKSQSEQGSQKRTNGFQVALQSSG